MTFFMLFFPASGYLGTPNTAKQGQTQNDKSTLFWPPTRTSTKSTINIVKNQEEGVLAKGVSAESSVVSKGTNNTQGYWAQQYICHLERHSQERRIFFANAPF